jgi:hypothetical protein
MIKEVVTFIVQNTSALNENANEITEDNILS